MTLFFFKQSSVNSLLLGEGQLSFFYSDAKIVPYLAAWLLCPFEMSWLFFQYFLIFQYNEMPYIYFKTSLIPPYISHFSEESWFFDWSMDFTWQHQDGTGVLLSRLLLLSCVQFLATPWTAARETPLSITISAPCITALSWWRGLHNSMKLSAMSCRATKTDGS